ncbi:DUF5682 family protein [Streptomyces boninensis]|uniref:DUF5682 family protein n=1 Tax=Streptomyces boninensis TaxID=2039455 RepID=UPI003B20BDC6
MDLGAGGAGGPAPGEPLLLGVRHHGPGSARAVRRALDAYEPSVVLIEGPPEADAIVELAGEEGMRPPVALLAHVVGDPARAAFWPLAGFSPEWVAIRWALERGIPVRFIDLPAAQSLALSQEEEREGAQDPGKVGPLVPDSDAVRIDPLAVLAETAGYDDPERWWEDAVEHRGSGSQGADALAAFAALGDAMAALRERYGDGGYDRDPVREAHMRLRLREAQRVHGERAAVVCGAWHVPALRARTTVAADRALLKGLPKVKAELAWVPWTHHRLARRSGYGAGIDSPGWYAHLFEAPDRPLERWLTKVARLLRDEGILVSSAHVIEAVRLAEALAAMRGRPLAGLAETLDAVRSVMCEGSDVPLALVEDRLVVGDVLGEVPESAPAVPLQRDLERQRRSLRLKPEAMERELQLDLRKDTDAGRSKLLHRLRLLDIPWGEPAASRGATGTFRETWRLRWEPELAVRVAEAAVWGTTVHAAATAKAESTAVSTTALADLTALAERCLLAGLDEALPVVMQALADRAALDADVGHLAQALPALARAVRYGDVRGTEGAALAEVAVGLAERIFVGLPGACAGLDADGAAELRGHVDGVHRAVGLLDPAAEAAEDASGGGAEEASGQGSEGVSGEAEESPSDAGTEGAPGERTEGTSGAGTEGAAGHGMQAPASGSAPPRTPGFLRTRWAETLSRIAHRDDLPGLIRGRAARLLLDDGVLGDDDAARVMGLALSPAVAPAEAAAWIEGFLGGEAGGGTLLVHDERLLALVDGWLTAIPDAAFTDVLPLLRRTFGAYEPGARRAIGELVARGGTAGARPAHATEALPGFGPDVDEARAAAVLPTLGLLLGQNPEEQKP